MAYADPQTTHNPATGTIAPAAWGDVIRDDLEWLARNRPSCKASASSAQSLSNATWTTIALGAETWDVGSCHSTVTNNSRLTVPSGGDGKYRILGQATFAANTTGDRHCRLILNGSLICGQDTDADASGFEHIMQVVAFENLVAGDYVELQQFQQSGGSLNTGSVNPHLSWIWETI